MWELNTLHCAWYCEFPRITLLLQCIPLPHLFSTFKEHSLDVFFFLPCLSAEHPQSVSIISLLERLIYRNPEDSFSETFLFLIIGPLFRCFSTFSFLFLRVIPIGTLSEGILTVSGGFFEGLGLSLSALRRATSIFGVCTQYVIGARRSMDAGGCRSMSTSVCRSMGVSACRAILTLSGLGGCGCFAANSL